jgi:hypothetical protein
VELDATDKNAGECKKIFSFRGIQNPNLGYNSRVPHLFNFSAMSRTRLAGLCCLLAQLCLSTIASAQPDETPAANPGRPTVSTPASLTPVGYLQFETGVLVADHSGDFSNRTSFNEVIKFAPIKRLQLLASTEPFASSGVGQQRSNNPGGVSLGLQAVAWQGEGLVPTISASYFRTVYGGSATDLDVGSSRNSVLLLISDDFGKFHVDTNYIFNEQIQDAVHRAQFGQTLSISHPVKGKLGLTGELWHFTQPFQQGNATALLFAANYNLKPNLVFDAGFNRGLTNTSTRWEFFAGFTYLLPKKLL